MAQSRVAGGRSTGSRAARQLRAAGVRVGEKGDGGGGLARRRRRRRRERRSAQVSRERGGRRLRWEEGGRGQLDEAGLGWGVIR